MDLKRKGPRPPISVLTSTDLTEGILDRSEPGNSSPPCRLWLNSKITFGEMRASGVRPF